ncbi:MAG: VCBS repeat-containing protein, partial [Planctomycetes bacterium]|nr:VCBS repeat-containing protein [Planctomycetota bacterium]
MRSRAKHSAAILAWLIGASLVSCDAARDDDPSTAGTATPRFAATFSERTGAAGVGFVHTNGMAGEKLLPETMGSGVVVFDYDRDGRLDLFFVDSRRWDDGASARSALYRGHGDGTFEDVTEATGAGIHRFGMGGAAADADGDGDPDLFITAVDGNVYLRNDGGRFVDATAEVGLTSRTWTDAEGREVPEWSTASAWFDADLDGDLDLFVGQYCKWTRAREIFTTLDGVHKAFTTPDRYEGLPPRLYYNDGAGHFSE